jgi:DNA repair exonuclease SbcCD nuclease subunit
MHKKLAIYTDIHFGAKSNDEVHLKDCSEFIDYVIDEVKKNNCDTIIFMGDWWENRHALNVMTINYALQNISKLNELNIPIYMIVGNHDLFFRNSRNMHSLELFRNFSNITIVDEPLSINDNMLLVPYLFKEEYAPLAPIINEHKYVFGHFEFRNFYLTGSSNTLCEHGFIHKLLNKPKYIFSGHYHKRQAVDNIVYIGNPFGTNFGDVDDVARGMAILNVETEELDLLDYNGPTYHKTSLSYIAENDISYPKNARIKCLIDIPISYSDAQQIKKDLMEAYQLRELILEENIKEQQAAISESAIKELDEMDLSSIDQSIKKLIIEGVQDIAGIQPQLLVNIYEGI